MSRTLVAIAAAVTLSLPAAPRAEDWGEAPPSDGYDVSVDLNAPGTSVTFDSFQAPLQPYGDWVVVGGYGQVWRPRVAAGWRPYYYGRWEWTNEGWFWVSDEPWGWATYHYGRWTYDPYYGWVWIPGNQWAPAWVSWRYSGETVGWAPLAPGYSVYVTTYPFVDFWWTFVPCHQFVSVPVYSVAYAPGHARRWYDATAPARDSHQFAHRRLHVSGVEHRVDRDDGIKSHVREGNCLEVRFAKLPLRHTLSGDVEQGRRGIHRGNFCAAQTSQ
jgi:hypothetical protein